jgi:threonine/homoserine/homoserine lactone efflux protein
LAEGRTTGLASGFGAATADAVCGVLVAAGLATTGILVSHAGLLKAVGGLLIILLGVLALRRFLRRSDESVAAAAAPSGAGILGAFSSTFALTLANPMTILAFVGLVAGLGASADGDARAPCVLVLGVFLGSALWWIGLVNVTLAVKSRLSLSLMTWLDAVSGGVLAFWGLWIFWEAL